MIQVPVGKMAGENIPRVPGNNAINASWVSSLPALPSEVFGFPVMSFGESVMFRVLQEYAR